MADHRLRRTRQYRLLAALPAMSPWTRARRPTISTRCTTPTAVVGLNTSAMIESAILGRPVCTVLLPEFYPRPGRHGPLPLPAERSGRAASTSAIARRACRRPRARARGARRRPGPQTHGSCGLRPAAGRRRSRRRRGSSTRWNLSRLVRPAPVAVRPGPAGASDAAALRDRPPRHGRGASTTSSGARSSTCSWSIASARPPGRRAVAPRCEHRRSQTAHPLLRPQADERSPLRDGPARPRRARPPHRPGQGAVGRRRVAAVRARARERLLRKSTSTLPAAAKTRWWELATQFQRARFYLRFFGPVLPRDSSAGRPRAQARASHGGAHRRRTWPSGTMAAAPRPAAAGAVNEDARGGLTPT